MASMRNFMRSLGITGVSVTPQTRAADGTLTDGTPLDLTNFVYAMEINFHALKEEVNVAVSKYENNDIIGDGFDWSITNRVMNDGSEPAKLFKQYYTADIFKLTFARGSGGSAKNLVAYTSRSGASMGFSGRGFHNETMTFSSVDAGNSTLSYT